MKKILVVLGVAVAVSAVGTGVYAAAAVDGENAFQEMLPFMKRMHPNFSDDQLQQMYNSCHGYASDGTAMMNGNFGGMMSRGAIAPEASVQ